MPCSNCASGSPHQYGEQEAYLEYNYLKCLETQVKTLQKGKEAKGPNKDQEAWRHINSQEYTKETMELGIYGLLP